MPIAATFYKVAVNADLVNTEPLLLEETQDWVPGSLSDYTFSSTDNSTTLFYVCFKVA